MYVGRIVDLLAPRRCAGCGAASAAPACAECAAELVTIAPVRERLLWCAFEYRGPAKRIIQRAKFDPGGLRGLKWLAQVAAERIRQAGVAQPEAVLAVPLGRSRLSQRGFNQALVLARILAETQHVPVVSGLVRKRETAPQVGLDKWSRRRNVAGAFCWVEGERPPSSLWLVDDVVTTGATTASARAALLAGGSARVQVVSLAREI